MRKWQTGREGCPAWQGEIWDPIMGKTEQKVAKKKKCCRNLQRDKEGEGRSESPLTSRKRGRSLPTGPSWLWWRRLEPTSWRCWSPGPAKNLAVRKTQENHYEALTEGAVRISDCLSKTSGHTKWSSCADVNNGSQAERLRLIKVKLYSFVYTARNCCVSRRALNVALTTTLCSHYQFIPWLEGIHLTTSS